MARARNIKPGFFTHEQMAENSPLGRLLFIGLTTIADYKGELEWRPKRIKIQLLPYDECSIEELAINLDHSGFIRFYSDGDKIYLKIVNFEKHQNPHKNERDGGSEVPAFSEELRQLVDLQTLAIKSEKIAINPEQDGTAPALSLIPYPSSLIPHPDCSTRDSSPIASKPAKAKTRLPVDFELTDGRRAAALEYWKTKNRPDLHPAAEFEKFLANHQSRGTRMADWNAAWKTWYCNAVSFVPPPRTPPGNPPRQTGQARDFSQIDYSQGVDRNGSF